VTRGSAIRNDFDLQQTARTWGWPAALGLLTASGLITALVSDSWGDAWSWFALGFPLAVAGWCSIPKTTR
jgi:hypothetical protein